MNSARFRVYNTDLTRLYLRRMLGIIGPMPHVALSDLWTALEHTEDGCFCVGIYPDGITFALQQVGGLFPEHKLVDNGELCCIYRIVQELSRHE